MTPWVRAFDALAKDLGLIFSIHSQWLVTTVPDSNTLFLLLLVCRCTCTFTHIYILKEKIKEIKAEPAAQWKRVRHAGARTHSLPHALQMPLTLPFIYCFLCSCLFHTVEMHCDSNSNCNWYPARVNLSIDKAKAELHLGSKNRQSQKFAFIIA